MSLPFDGFKAAQTGLVDMGNISFSDNTSPPNPPTPRSSTCGSWRSIAKASARSC